MPDQAEASSYFVMTCEGLYPATDVDLVSEWDGAPWMTGEYFTEDEDVPDPLLFETNPLYPGELLPMYEGTILLMRDDLIQGLQDVGVDNLQLFSAVVRDKETHKEYKNYKGVNIVGVVSSADMDESELMDPTDDTDIIAVDFHSLVLDETKTGGALLFRLAESVSAIVVHQRVRDRVSSIPGMTFYAAGEWSG